jgi:hypothetical protein
MTTNHTPVTVDPDALLTEAQQEEAMRRRLAPGVRGALRAHGRARSDERGWAGVTGWRLAGSDVRRPAPMRGMARRRHPGRIRWPADPPSTARRVTGHHNAEGKQLLNRIIDRWIRWRYYRWEARVAEQLDRRIAHRYPDGRFDIFGE